MNNLWEELSNDSKGQLIEYYKNLKSSSNKDFLEDLFGKENLKIDPEIKTWESIDESKLGPEYETIKELEDWNDKKLANKLIATFKISKIIELGYKKVTLDEFRNNDLAFFVIWARTDEKIEVIESYDYDDLLTFRSYNEAKEFLNNNLDLLKDYFQIN